MRSHLRNNIVGYLALFVALSGTAVAGSFVVTSSKQVKDASLTGADVRNASLTGTDVRDGSLGVADLAAAARASLRGPQGEAGPRGADGARGPAGEVVDTLPSGRTLRGTYALIATASAPNQVEKTGISFGLALASQPSGFVVIAAGGAPTAACPGSPDDPRAAPGNLCLYEFTAVNRVAGAGGLLLDNPSNTLAGFRFGATVQLRAAAAGEFQSRGTWAVTAP